MTDDSPPARLRGRAWLPDPTHAARLARNTLLIWLAIHFALLTVPDFVLNAGGAVTVVPMTALGVALDARRQRGTLFYANLGVPPAWAWIVGLAVAGVLEAVAWRVVKGGG